MLARTQLYSVWVGSVFCVMRTSLGTPRAGALLLRDYSAGSSIPRFLRPCGAGSAGTGVSCIGS